MRHGLSLIFQVLSDLHRGNNGENMKYAKTTEVTEQSPTQTKPLIDYTRQII